MGALSRLAPRGWTFHLSLAQKTTNLAGLLRSVIPS